MGVTNLHKPATIRELEIVETRTHTLGPHTSTEFFLFDLGVVFQSVKLTNERDQIHNQMTRCLEYNIICSMNKFIGPINN